MSKWMAWIKIIRTPKQCTAKSVGDAVEGEEEEQIFIVLMHEGMIIPRPYVAPRKELVIANWVGHSWRWDDRLIRLTLLSRLQIHLPRHESVRNANPKV